MAKNYFFQYDGNKIEVDAQTLTGAAIKAAIKQEVPSFDVTHDLVLEGKGNDPDAVIGDNDPVDLSNQHGGPKKFFSRPPTNFGGSA